VASNTGPVVSNTTPLINLVGLGCLDLLPRLYGKVTIPEEVHDEYLAGKRPGDPELASLSWLAVVPSTDSDPLLTSILGSGEAAAITLAMTHSARAVLLDETIGRQAALMKGLPVVGTLGILLAAKQAGFVAAVRPLLDEMIRQGRWISSSLRAGVTSIGRTRSVKWRVIFYAPGALSLGAVVPRRINGREPLWVAQSGKDSRALLLFPVC
jgi:predicted nucleic acid-binding protein